MAAVTGPGTVGLRNLGNTAFMNTILQCLVQTPPLIDYFLDDTYVAEVNKENPLAYQGEFVEEFATVIKAVWGADEDVFDPRAFKAVVGKYMPQYAGYQQHDVSEFLMVALDALHEELNRVLNKPYTDLPEAGDKSDADYAKECMDTVALRNDSVIYDYCLGTLKSCVECSACESKYRHFDPCVLFDLPLPPMKEGGSLSLTECINEFHKREKLSEQDMFYCSNCKDFDQSMKQMQLYTLPDILIFKLKRAVAGTKVTTLVNAPVSGLDLSEYVCGEQEASDLVYDLYAVAEHIGNAGGGHEVAKVKHAREGGWVCADDSSVSAIGEDEIVTSNAYVLFYKRRSKFGE